MGNTVRLSYSRKFTNKLGDGSFEGFELGADAELELGEVESIDEVNAAYDQLYAQFVSNVESKVLETQGNLVPAPSSAPAEQEAPAGSSKRLESWVKKSVATETDKIRPKALPGERFKTPPTATGEAHVQSSDIVEGEAVSFENVKVFFDNKQTKIGTTQRGKKFGMLRLGGKGFIPGDYVTGKSFEPEIVEDIETVIDEKIDRLDVFGYWEPRNNDPEIFDLVLQGLKPAEG